MWKIILTLIFLYSSWNGVFAQVLAVSDTIKELDYYTPKYIRKNTQYSPEDEERNQNFANLRIEKVVVENQTFYVMVFNKISVTYYDISSYVTLAVEFGRKSTSQYDSFNDSFFFAFTEE